MSSKQSDQSASLDLDDIQHFLMSRPPARAARYEFLAFKTGSEGRAWLTGLIDKVGTASVVGSSLLDARWVTVGFTWNGLQMLGVDDASLATFPEEFRQGMAARAGVLGTTGANHPDHWVGGLASPNLHAIVVLFARDVAERERCRQEHANYLKQRDGVKLLSALDLEAIPPFDYAHEHFGYRDRLSQPVIERSEEHTSELQSRLHLVCRLLLEKKKYSIYTAATTDRNSRHHAGPSQHRPSRSYAPSPPVFCESTICPSSPISCSHPPPLSNLRL